MFGKENLAKIFTAKGF